MNQEEIIAVQQYENALSRVDKSVDKITVLMSSAQSLAQQGTQIMNCFAQLKREQQAYEAQFNELKLKLQSDLIKFQNIVKGAEARLDRHLDRIDKWTNLLLTRDLGTMDSQELQYQRNIMDAIQMANDNFNKELDKLYSL